MFKIFYFLPLFLIVFGKLVGQENQFLGSTTILGENYITHLPVSGQIHTFDQYIYDSQVDSLSNIIVLQLRETNKKRSRYNNVGKIVIYDFVECKKLWEKPVNYLFLEVKIIGKSLHLLYPSNTKIYDLETGNLLQDLDYRILYIDTCAQIGIGYRTNVEGKTKNKLEGRSLYSGQKLWEKPFPLQFGCDHIFPLKDSIVLLSTNGLHACNIYNGKGWDYNVTTAQKDFTKNIATNALGIASGFLTGTFFYSTGHDLLFGLHSNILQDSSGFYFASRDDIARLDTAGHILWQIPFSPKQAGSSKLFLRDTILYMINYGLGSFNKGTIATNIPFLAAYHAHSGEKLFLTPMSESPTPIVDYIIKQDQLLVALEGSIQIYSLKGGNCIFSQNYTASSNEKWRYFLRTEVYTQQDSLFTSFHRDDSSYFYIVTEHKILGLSKTSEGQQEFDLQNLYPCYQTYGSYRFLLVDKKTIVIDKNNQVIAKLDFTNRNHRVGSKIFYIKKNALYCFDFEQLLMLPD